MGKMQRDKGNRFEREVVNYFKDQGIKAKRMPLSGAAEGFEGDVILGSRQCECKHHESFSNKFWDWIVGNKYLFIRKNRKSPLAIMEIEELARLLKIEGAKKV